MCRLEWRFVYVLMNVFFLNYKATGQINTKMILEWVHKQLIMTRHELFYFLHTLWSHKLASRKWYSHIGTVLNLVSFYSGDDITTDCATHNVTWQLWHVVSNFPDSKVHGANMGPIWGWQDPGGPHDGPMNFAIWVVTYQFYWWQYHCWLC